MFHDRFLQILWKLHLCDPTTSLQRQSYKVQPLIDILCPRCSASFKLGKFIFLDEAVVALRVDGAWCHQYLRGKPHPFGIKAFVLADSETGYLHGVRFYFGKETDILPNPNLLKTTRIVLTLTQPLEGMSHYIIIHCNKY